MHRNSYNHQNWNEFQWEREIRKDEKRINRYFEVLKSCLDLPGEEDVIMNRLMAQPDLVPTNADWSSLGLPEMFFDDDDDDSADLRNRKGSEIYKRLEKLAAEWNIIFASQLRDSLFREGMALLCQFGKLLSRCADMLEVDETVMPHLKISLAKRMLSDLNILLGMLKDIRRRQSSLAVSMENFNGHLQNIREKVIDAIHEIRSAAL